MSEEKKIYTYVPTKYDLDRERLLKEQEEKKVLQKRQKKKNLKIELDLRSTDTISSRERTLEDQRRVYAKNYNIDTKNKTTNQIDKELDKEAKKRRRGNWRKSSHIRDEKGNVRARDISAVDGVPWSKLSTKEQNETIKHYLNKGWKVLEEGDHLHIEHGHGKKGFGRFGSKFADKSIRTGRTDLRVFGKKHKEFKKLLQEEENIFQNF